MDCEPLPKRRRTVSPPLDSKTQPHIPPKQINHPPQEGDDKTYQLHLERAFADPRFRATLAQIFDKYGHKVEHAGEATDSKEHGLLDGEEAKIDISPDNDNAAVLDGLDPTNTLHYDLLALQDQHGNGEDTGPVGCQIEPSNEPTTAYLPRETNAEFTPSFPTGANPSSLLGWYSNPFEAVGPFPSQWDGVPASLSLPLGALTNSGPWMTPQGFVYGPAPWSASTAQPAHSAQATQSAHVLERAFAEQQTGIEESNIFSHDPTQENGEENTETNFDVLFRKRPMKPRFSKNGKRLGRPPKTSDDISALLRKETNESGPLEGEGEEGEEGEDNDRAPATAPSAAEPVDDSLDTLWEELDVALQRAAKATSKKRQRGRKAYALKGETSATESDGAMDPEQDIGQTEAMLRSIQQRLIRRAVRRSTSIGEQEEVAEAEGRRRSGRERKPVNFGEQVSWSKVSAERRATYKITMHLRALATQARRERRAREQREAEEAAKKKKEADEEAAKKKKEADEEAARKKKEADEVAAKKKKEADEEAARKEKEAGEEAASTEAETTRPVAGKALVEAEDNGAANSEETGASGLPSTIPDSQDTVTSLPIRTTPQKPQSKQIMRPTKNNHVNSVVHFEEDDDDVLSANDTSAITTIIKPLLSLHKKAAKPVPSFLGENYMDTVYALSDDEAPALLDSLKRVHTKVKRPTSEIRCRTSQTSVAVALPQCDWTQGSTAHAEPAEKNQGSGREMMQTHMNDADMALSGGLEETDLCPPATSAPAKPAESDNVMQSNAPNGMDLHDSGIDIPNEKVSIERCDRDRANRHYIAAEFSFLDPDLQGAEDLLDSLDVLSETEDSPFSPILNKDTWKLGTVSGTPIPSKDTSFGASPGSPLLSKVASFGAVLEDESLKGSLARDSPVEHSLFVDDISVLENNEILQTVAKENGDLASGPIEIEPCLNAVEEATLLEDEAMEFLPDTDSSFVFIEENPSETKKSPEIQLMAPPRTKTPTSPPNRYPSSQQMRLTEQNASNRSISPMLSASLPVATSRDTNRERSHASSSSSSKSTKTSAPFSRSDSSSNGTKGVSRRSLLSLIDGGEEDIETLRNRKPKSQKPKPAQMAPDAPAQSSASARAQAASSSSSSKRSTSSSRRGSKTLPASSSAASLPRFGLSSLSDFFSRDAHRSSKERKERKAAKERKRRSAQQVAAAASGDSTRGELKTGTCGVDGYTCGRDFCFTCL